MRAYIADSYSLNSGDVGILLSTLDMLDANGVQTTIELSHPSSLKKSNDPALRNKEMYPRVFDISKLDESKLKAVLLGTLDSVLFVVMAAFSRLLGKRSTLLVRKSRRQQARRLIEADFLISSGGGFLSSYYLYGFRLYVYALAILMGKRFIIFRQSVGPFTTRLSRLLIPSFLRRAAYIQLRETYSSSLMEQYPRFGNIEVYPDVAFTLKAKRRTRQAGVYGFCLKDTAITSAYSKAVLALCEQLLSKKDTQIRLFSHTVKDDAYVQAIAHQLNDGRVRVVRFTTDARLLKELYSECELLVSSRMHAIIFAAANGVPFIALSYEPKFAGLLNMVGNKRLLIDDQQLNAQNLIEAFTYYRQHAPAIEAALAESLRTVQVEVDKGNRHFMQFMESYV